MSPANDPVQDIQPCDGLRLIEINPPLPCGVARCGRLAHSGRIERDPAMGALWRLLPICDQHLTSLAAAAGEVARAPHHESSAT